MKTRRVPATFAAVLLAAVAAGALARQEGWRAERPGQPGKDLNAVHFVDSRRGWVAGDGGLVLRTEDA
ncbi:MAG TPA: hypothetical protein VF754_01450, partial [Pyrinomonadaceae bacterium]